MKDFSTIVENILNGCNIEKNEALSLINIDSGDLRNAADRIRQKFNSDSFEFCSVINAKSGICTENCGFCAQSRWHKTNISTYDLLDASVIRERAVACFERGITRFSIVTSGKALTDAEIDKICIAVYEIRKEINIGMCVSLGLINESQFKALKESGVTRVHNNLETSKNFFPRICTTHSYDDKLNAIESAKKNGFEICSGGIIGMGETFEDWIDLAFEVRRVGAKSMPVNVLNPIPGTPMQMNRVLSAEDAERAVSVFKIINPDITIRMAGGRILLKDMGSGCFLSGANAAITGDMLTTNGISIEEDVKNVKRLNYRI